MPFTLSGSSAQSLWKVPRNAGMVDIEVQVQSALTTEATERNVVDVMVVWSRGTD